MSEADITGNPSLWVQSKGTARSPEPPAVPTACPFSWMCPMSSFHELILGSTHPHLETALYHN